MSFSEEIQANLDRAISSLQAAKLLLSSNFSNDAVSRAYYAAFHAASALLLSRDLAFGSHTGVLRAVSLHFVKTGALDKQYGRDLNWLAELRQTADYGELRNLSMADAQEAVEKAERFVQEVRYFLDNQML
ncbi:MAG: HEPN domain-containing protein [Leptolyngbyaceae cyanobacterium SM2_5_2]|nr:HEPN domain-containing protein [Leptolyngbyaceae cyanobacterium SM2_5_2]